MNSRALGLHNPVRRLSGTADIDVSASDYTVVGGINLIEIAVTGREALEDVYIVFDLAKATTGFKAGYTTETIVFSVARKVDGTNWRIGKGPQETSAALSGDNSTTGAIGLHIGPIHPTEDCRIYVRLTVEQADVELPYVIYYKGRTPTVTAVAA